MTPGTTRHQSRDILGHELDNGHHFKERVTEPNGQQGGREEPVHTSDVGTRNLQGKDCRTVMCGAAEAGLPGGGPC